MHRVVASNQNVSFRAASALLAKVGVVSRGGRQLCKDLEKDLDISTPVGTLLRTVRLPLRTGGTYAWMVANPLALIWILCGNSAAFGRFVQEHLGHLKSRIAVNSDETTPGNNLGPNVNKARKMQCIYWTFMEWPCWFRGRKHGWLPFGYLRSKCGADLHGIFHPQGR